MTPDYTSWSKFQGGSHPDYIAPDSLDMHVAWCVWHEGDALPENSTIHTIGDFRSRCASSQDHNNPAKELIMRTTNVDLYNVLNGMSQYFDVPANGGYQMLFFHLHWVCHHEGKRLEMLQLLDARNFDRIRMTYQGAQQHNKHVRHLVQAAKNATLEHMLDRM